VAQGLPATSFGEFSDRRKVVDHMEGGIAEAQAQNAIAATGSQQDRRPSRQRASGAASKSDQNKTNRAARIDQRRFGEWLTHQDS